MKRFSLLLCWVLLILAGLSCHAGAEMLETEASLSADGSSLLGDVLVQEWNQQTGSGVTGLAFEDGQFTTRCNVQEPGTLVVRVYTDSTEYIAAEDRQLLWQSAPVAVAIGESTFTVPLSGYTLPEYFEADAVFTGESGETCSYTTSAYTYDIVFAKNATREDFKPGYYVALKGTTPIDDSKENEVPSVMTAALASAPSEDETETNAATAEVEADGYVAYNPGLILLSSDTKYTVIKESSILVFDELPAALAGMSEEEILAIDGFVVRSATSVDEDVFFLNGGISLKDSRGALVMSLREPETLDEMYESMNIALASPGTETWEHVHKDGCYDGKVSYTPTAGANVTLHGWKVDFHFSIGNWGHFNLNLGNTNPGTTDFMKLPSNREKLNVDIPSPKLGFGLTMSIDSDLYVAASDEVHIEGTYGQVAYFSIGMSGVDWGYENSDGVAFTNVHPLVENKEVYAYFAWDMSCHVKGFEFDFLLFTIGPVIDCSMTLTAAGRTVATLEKDQVQEIGEDVYHDCCLPGKDGCISGRSGKARSIALRLKLDMFFAEKTWTLAKQTTIDQQPDIDYFYESLTHAGESEAKANRHGVQVYCPYKLYRVSGKTTENQKYPLVGAVISGTNLASISEPTTDENGLTRLLYLPKLVSETQTLQAVDAQGKAIDSANVSNGDLDRHRTISFDRSALIVEKVNIQGWFPEEKGGKVYRGKGVRTEKSDNHYYPEVDNASAGSSEVWGAWYGVPMDVSWDGEMPDSPEEVQITTPGTHRVEFTLDFSEYAVQVEGKTYYPKVASTVQAQILGSDYGNPHVYEYQYYYFTITDVKVSDKVSEDSNVVASQALLTICADFVVKDDDHDYVLVRADNGLENTSRRFYPRGATALVVGIGSDLDDLRQDLIAMVPDLDSEAWSDTEKESLIERLLNQPTNDQRFLRWEVYAGSGLTFSSDFTPTITDEGVLSYNGATFTVPTDRTIREVHLSAVYDSSGKMEIDKVEVNIARPVPGEFLNTSKYSQGSLITEHVGGVEGEDDGLVNLRWFAGEDWVNSAIRYNTTYFVEAYVEPTDGYVFKYPLGTENGTRAYVRPDGDQSEEQEAISFRLEGKYPTMRFTFTTRKAKLLSVQPQIVLYYPVGVQAQVINRALSRMGTGITTEDESITEADVNWDTVTQDQIPTKAGESFDVPGVVQLPDSIECDNPELLNIHAHIIMVGGHEVQPPVANPEPGVYRRDVQVTLTAPDPEATIYYATEEGAALEKYEPGTKIPLYRAAHEIVTRTIYAMAEKDGVQSVLVSFEYILMPAESEYRLTVLGGAAISSYGMTTDGYVPFGADVALIPLTSEIIGDMYRDDLVFECWEVMDAPEDFTWTSGDEFSENPHFSMPAQDVVIQGYYHGKDGQRVITDIMMVMQPPNLGDTSLSEQDMRSSIWTETNGRTVSTLIEKCTDLVWDTEVSEEDPVRPGGSYTFDAEYTIEKLVEKTKTGYSADERFQDSDLFSPGITVNVNGQRAYAIVSGDLKEVMVEKTFDFPLTTYCLRYYGNGGDLGEIPECIMEVTDTPTALTELKPTREDGIKFLGWSTDPSADEPEYVYDEENPITFNTDTDLYAIWEPYTLEVRWLDYNNKCSTRQSFTLTIDDTQLTVDPKDAATKDGVGVQTFTLRLPNVAEHTLQITGEKDGLLSFGETDGVENLYRVASVPGGSKGTLTLTSVRRLHAEKEWDIDFEKKDRPDSVTAILQTTAKPEEESLMDRLLRYVKEGGVDWETAISEIEKITGYSLKNLSAEAAASKVAQLILDHKLTTDNLTDALKSLLKADTNDSTVDDVKYYGVQTLKLEESGEWKGTFEPVDRFSGTLSTDEEDGHLKAEWKDEPKLRVVEKSGKAPVEDGKDATFTVPAYTNLAGKEVEEHKTVYQVSYKTEGDTTTITNLAVEDHRLKKEWVLFGKATKPENIYAVLLWRYDEDYLNAAKELISVELPLLWLPEENPISGDKISVGDILKSMGLIDIPIIGSIEIPLAIAKLNEDNKWEASFRVRKYGNFGLPLEHEAAEFCSAIVQDVLKYFLGVDIPIGINPLQGFISVSVPEFTFPLTTTKIDMMINTWAKGDDDDDEKHTVAGSKVWEDDGDSAGLRPKSITLHLWEDGSKHVADITVKDDTWFGGGSVWAWKYKDDAIDTEKHTYTVTEEEVPGYQTTISGLNVVNSLSKSNLVSLEITKRWEEGGQTASHDALTLTVLRNEEVLQSVTLSAAEGWTTILTDMPSRDANGNTYRYSIREDAVPGGYTESYSVRYSGSEKKWYLTVTNARKSTDPEKITLRGNKVWEDDNNKQGKRPSSVTIHLWGDGVEVDVFTLSAANGWHWSGTYDKTNEAGETITYSITEDEVPGYQTKISGLNVVNSLQKISMVDLVIAKKWEDDGQTVSHEALLLTVLRDGDLLEQVTVSEANSWTTTLTVPSRDDSGSTSRFSIREDAVPVGYTDSYSARYNYSENKWYLTVTNTYKGTDPEKITLRGDKTWVDENNLHGKRPNSVTIRLWRDHGGEYEPVDVFTLSESNGWHWSGTYPKNYDWPVREISYFITEDEVAEYTTEIKGFDVYNYLVDPPEPDPDRLNLVVRKKWQDTDEAHPAVPVTLQLTRNGEAYGDVFELSEGNNWTLSFGNLLKKDGETSFTYGVTENPVPEGFTVSYQTSYNAATKTLTITVTNRRTGEDEVVIGGCKYWNDGMDALGLRPASVTYLLLADGEAVDRLILNPETQWKWSGAYPEKKDGKRITYTVEELPVQDHTAVYKDNKLSVQNTPVGSDLTITNTLLSGDTEKVFTFHIQLLNRKGKPFNGSLGATYGATVLNLDFENGETVVGLKDGDKLTVKGIPDGWTYRVWETDCDGYITWVVDEENQIRQSNLAAAQKKIVPKGDYPDRTQARKANLKDSLAEFYNDATRSITVTKVWDDENDKEGLRPESITVTILADYQAYATQVIQEDEEGKWEYTFENLPTMNGTKPFKYTVAEDAIPYYKTTIRDFTITNTYHKEIPPDPYDFTFTFYKVWKDGKSSRPAPSFTLYNSRGEVVRGPSSKPRRVAGKNMDTYTYWLKEEDDYYVVETPMNDYVTTYENTKQSGHREETDRVYARGTITNTQVPHTGDSANLALWLGLSGGMLSGLTVMWLLLRRKKKQGSR